MNIRKLDALDRDQVNAYVRYLWGGPMMVTRGQMFDTSELPGFVAESDGALLGAVLYRMEGDSCECAGLFALVSGHGVGTRLLNAVIEVAKASRMRRLWLVTTNDNTRAIRFYQKFGFSLKAVHIGAFEETCKLKSESPALGDDRIPIAHEFEFEMILS